MPNGALKGPTGARCELKYRRWPSGLKHGPAISEPSWPTTRATAVTVESGRMTKDLALLVGPDQPWLTTEEFLAALDDGLAARLA